VIPREVRGRLKLEPGDILRYRLTEQGISLDKAAEAGNDPFAGFSEWTLEADEKAYGALQTRRLGAPGQVVKSTSSNKKRTRR